MIKDYYKPLKRRVVSKTPDGAGSYTEVVADSNIEGYIAQLSSFEQNQSAQLKLFIVARLFCEESLSETDLIIDEENNIEYEVSGKYNFFHKYYELKKKVSE